MTQKKQYLKSMSTPSSKKDANTATKRGFPQEDRNGSNDWYTPQYIFDALGERYDLDPCSPGKGKSHTPADRVLTIEDDGLATDWDADAFVWCNPPYDNTLEWLTKVSEHPGGGLVLVNSRTDTQWFHRLVGDRATAVCFVEGRIKFHEGDILAKPVGSPKVGSVLVAYGERAAAALDGSGLGLTMRISEPATAVATAA